MTKGNLIVGTGVGHSGDPTHRGCAFPASRTPGKASRQSHSRSRSSARWLAADDDAFSSTSGHAVGANAGYQRRASLRNYVSHPWVDGRLPATLSNGLTRRRRGSHLRIQALRCNSFRPIKANQSGNNIPYSM